MTVVTDGGTNDPRMMKIYQEWAKTGSWGALRNALRSKYGFDLKNVSYGQGGYNTPGPDLKSAWDFFNRGKTSKDWNSFIYNVRQGRRPDDQRQPPGRPVPPAGGVQPPVGDATGTGTAGMGMGGSGGIDPVDYQSFLGMGSQVPGLVSVGTLMGRNPFGPGFGFNPMDYAQSVTKAKYDPLYQSITNRVKQEQEMSDASQQRINDAYQPLIDQTQQQGVASTERSQALAANLAALAGQMGEGTRPQATSTAGYILGNADITGRDNDTRVNEVTQGRNSMVADFMAQKNQSIRDLRDQRLELTAARGDEFKANLLQGISARQDLLTGAVANRGALFSQAMTQAMGRPTLALSNIQAQQAMDDLLRARTNGEITVQQANAQLQQAQQAGLIDQLTAQQMQQQLTMGDMDIQDRLNGGSGGGRPIGRINANDRSALWGMLAQNYTSLTQTDPDIPVSLNNQGAISALYNMALGSGAVQVGNEKQRKDLVTWLSQMTGYTGDTSFLAALTPGGAGISGTGRAPVGGGTGSQSSNRPGVSLGPIKKDKNGRRYRLVNGRKMYLN